MLPDFSADETRVIGALIEKSIVTPDQYPMTLNALTNACNQKSARNPVTSLTKSEVSHAAKVLEAKHFLRIEQNFKSGVDKYAHRFCNSRYSEYQFADDELAIICLLLLRGPQTPGELRARSGRLHSFADNQAVVDACHRLVEREGGPVLVKLPRTPGRKDAEYMHLFAGDVDVDAYASQAEESKPRESGQRVNLNELAERVSQLEAEVAGLKERLGE